MLHQQGWLQTAHSWTATGPLPSQRVAAPNGVGNQDSAGFADECAWCHATNGRNSGRAANDSIGWMLASADQKKYYTDVQCEGCHGPGAAHVTTPDQTTTWPTGTIVSDTGLKTGCSVCHNEPDNPYGAEWRRSAHGSVNTIAASQGAPCVDCHEGKAVVSRFDPGAQFAEQGSSTPYAITCVACHDPHAKSGAFSAEPPAYDQVWLRAPIDVADLSANLCMQCHNRRATPDPTTSRGAHAAQGPMLLGLAGWQPPGFTYAGFVPSHGGTNNPKLCVGCHMYTWGFTSPTGKPWNTPGHHFWAIPCIRPDSSPDTTNTCALTSRNFNACSASGCHASAATAQMAFQALDTRLQGYLDALWKDTDGNGVIDSVDSGLLTKVPSSEFTVNGTTTTVAQGALFNTTLVRTADGSHGVHNPLYEEALLIATIRAVSAKYGLPLPPGISAQMTQRATAIGMGP